MTKLIITGRRRQGLTRAGLSRHLLQVHGPMVVAPPPDAGAMPGGYVQNHVFDGTYSEDTSAIDLDFVTELWFDSPRHAAQSVQTPYYAQSLQPDEPNFVRQSSVQRCFATEEIVRAVADPGTRKAFLFLSQAGSDDAAFQAAWSRARMAAAMSPDAAHVRRWIANVTSAIPGQPRPYDGIDELWFAGDPERTLGLLRQMVRAMGGDAVGREFILFAEEFSSERIRSGT